MSGQPLPAETRAFLSQPSLTPLWTAVRARLERNGLAAAGTIRLTGLDAAQREALSLLLGRPVARPDPSIRLADLDARLRTTAAGCGLVEVTGLLGPPLTDRRAVRAAARARTDMLWESTRQAVADSAIAGAPWAGAWLDDVRRTGTVARLDSTTAESLLRQAVHALALLYDEPPRQRPRGRAELASAVTGSAHGLDDDTLLSRLVLRGIALATGTEVPNDAPSRRARWRAAGVSLDEVFSTVLTYALRPTGSGWRERALRERADHHAETHFTLRDLHAVDLSLEPGSLVRICENPRVIEAAAEAACRRPLVCTSGSAATVVLTLLDALAATGCRFAYHGDFDWPGIVLANRIITRYDAAPWRMCTMDYEQLVSLTRLRGTPVLPLTGLTVEAAWDPELAPTMTALRMAVHEEAALDLLVKDLL